MGAMKILALFTHRATLAFVLGLFLCVGLTIDSSSLWRIVFHALLLPVAVVQLVAHAGALRHSRSAILCFLLIGYLLLTMAWGVDQSTERIDKYIRGAVGTAIFVGSAILAFENRRDTRRLLDAIIVACAFGCVVSLSLYLGRFIGGEQDVPARLTGVAQLRHPIAGAAIACAAAAMAAYRLLTTERLAARLAYGAAIVVFFTFVLLTRSRGVIISAFLVLIPFIWRQHRLALLLGLATLAAIAAVLLTSSNPQGVLADTLSRPPNRVEIWEFTLARVRQHPFFGHGLAAIFGLPEPFSFPHNLFLSALFYGGGVGLVLLLAMLASILFDTLRLADRLHRALLLALLLNAVVIGMTTLGQPVRTQAEIWYILWLPVGMAIGAALGAPARTPLSAPSAQVPSRAA